MIAHAREKVAQNLAPVEELLGKREVMLESFSVADVVLGGVLWWGNKVGLIDGLPNTRAWIDRLSARPAFKRATAD